MMEPGDAVNAFDVLVADDDPGVRERVSILVKSPLLNASTPGTPGPEASR